jgi:hypothetical protein
VSSEEVAEVMHGTHGLLAVSSSRHQDLSRSTSSYFLLDYLAAILEAQRHAFSREFKIENENYMHRLIDRQLQQGGAAENFHTDCTENKPDRRCTVIEVWHDGYLESLQYADHIIPKRTQNQGFVRSADSLVGELKYCRAIDASRIPSNCNAWGLHYPFDPFQYRGYKSYLQLGGSRFLVYAIAVVDRDLLWTHTRFLILHHADGTVRELLSQALQQVNFHHYDSDSDILRDS